MGTTASHAALKSAFAAAVALAVLCQAPWPRVAFAEQTCQKADFEQVVEDSAAALRDLNAKNKPAFQEKLKQLKDKRGWSHEQFMTEAAPFVRDDKTAEFDQQTDDLLSAISTMGEEGASSKTPDCAVLLELRARLKVLVDTQNAKWSYMSQKLDTELWK